MQKTQSFRILLDLQCETLDLVMSNTTEIMQAQIWKVTPKNFDNKED